MKYLELYKTLNLENNEEHIFQYLLDTLTKSIFSWDYFTDFPKAIKNVNLIEKELNYLNKLIGLDETNIKSEYLKLVMYYPEVRTTLVELIALRKEKLKSTFIIDDLENLSATDKSHLFNPKYKLEEKDLKDHLQFFEQSGLMKFFVDSEVHNVVDYVKGIEVGMDTNARKNRTGTQMENLVEKLVYDVCLENNWEYDVQGTKKSIFTKWGIEIELDKINRRFDFVIKDSQDKLHCIEVNYYGSGGSKLKATAGEYKELHDFLKKQNLNFIWITDGQGWHTASTALNETFHHIDFLFNLDMISKGALKEVLMDTKKIFN